MYTIKKLRSGVYYLTGIGAADLIDDRPSSAHINIFTHGDVTIQVQLSILTLQVCHLTYRSWLFNKESHHLAPILYAVAP